MRSLLNTQVIALLFILVCSAGLAISAGIARDVVRCIAYGIVALLALIVAILALIVA